VAAQARRRRDDSVEVGPVRRQLRQELLVPVGISVDDAALGPELAAGPVNLDLVLGRHVDIATDGGTELEGRQDRAAV